ncbi:hypothetical protein [Bremerella cremea]|uniref:hypothetical protein n=1 Tax=Bremerella cremea TaxID=1031537 RepID=UPI0031EBBC27
MKETFDLIPGRRASWNLAGTLLCLAMLGGCTAEESDRFVITGNATYDGKPIPAGELVFTPDTSRGNKGPQGKAKIVDGKFTTRGDGRGVVGGPHRVELRAFDGVAFQDAEMTVEEGRPLFGSLKGDIDLPPDSAVIDAHVTTQGGKSQMKLSLVP